MFPSRSANPKFLRLRNSVRKKEKEEERSYFQKDLLGLVIYERDDPGPRGLDELDIGGRDVGCASDIAEPAGGAVPRVGHDPDYRQVVEGGVRRRAARRVPGVIRDLVLLSPPASEKDGTAHGFCVGRDGGDVRGDEDEKKDT
ncbi:hypothetical protein GW17_00003800 [Ensete ventricosum]|nr:hypothetical protein GW17_00003800 [Ensete ventricosum]